MAITHYSDDPELSARHRERLSHTEYYGVDGWPVGFPDEQRSIDVAFKRELQVSHHNWRRYDTADWRAICGNPTLPRRMRLQARVAYGLLPAISHAPRPA